ncbi:hypothetical protein BT93_L3138 [Corymbia citriodora subsp. variegata]|uniref:Phytocyanin domain-containing protein n=1 Tax=Corymbia citriodora subsp. variegata TaxID=360336 RepID=A0A8T0CI23_CORYI|nr:hypothetical protein BT93_L3138 [Corymbia citriodora subsp. variegata]
MARLGKCSLNVAAAVMMSALLLPSLSYATTYYVGDSFGWSYDIDLDSWVGDKTFYVNDVLGNQFYRCHFFVYDNTYHNVVSVDANGYNTCSANSNYGIFTSGNDEITLTSAGTWYFICSYHCDFANQKMAVTVYHRS